MKLSSSSFHFLLPLMIVLVPLAMCQNDEGEKAEQLETPTRYGRFVRYAKQSDHEIQSAHDTKSVHEDPKAIHASKDDEKACDCNKKDKEETGGLKTRLDWIRSLSKNRHAGDHVVPKHRKFEDEEEYGEPQDEKKNPFTIYKSPSLTENSEDGESTKSDESFVDEREDYETDDHSEIARSAASSFLDPGTSEICEDGANCSSINNQNGQDRVLERSTSAKSSRATSDIAMKAIAADSRIEAAGNEASKQAKSLLAFEAAKASQFGLAEKEATFGELEREIKESETVVHNLSSSIDRSMSSTNAALRAAQQATAQVKLLTEAVQTAQSNLANSEQAAQGAQQELSEKTQLLEAAKNRVEQLLRELKTAKIDFANMKQAAFKALAAAKHAKSNASRTRRYDDSE